MNDRLAVAFGRTFGPALMLLMDQPHSPGMLVRPRPGRIELCGEHVVGDSLAIATVFALAAVETLEHAIRGDGELPPFLDVVLEPGRRRYGWYIDRSAYGDDLYDRGRSASLRLAGGGNVSAGDWLEACWRLIRPTALRVATVAEVEEVDACVAGRTGLPLERGLFGVVADAPVGHPPEPIGLGAQILSSDTVTLIPCAATWDWVAWRAQIGSDHVALMVPRASMPAVERALGRGELAEAVSAAIDQRTSLATLSHTSQLGAPAFFAQVQPGTGLLPNDRMGIGNAPASAARPNKRELPVDRTQTRPARTGSGLGVLVLLALLVGLLATIAGPAVAQEQQDPRSVPSMVQPIEVDGELWFLIDFEQRWTDGPPLDLFSMFFEVQFQIGDRLRVSHWEVHDGVAASRASRPLLLLDDGRLLASMHREVPDPFDFTATMSTGSWQDESGSAVFSDHAFPTNDSTLLGSAAISGTTPIFDLQNGVPFVSQEPVPWMGLESVFPGQPMSTTGDPMVSDPLGDQTDYFGLFDTSYPDVTGVDVSTVAFGPDFAAGTRMEHLSRICGVGLDVGTSVCPNDLSNLSNAGGWTFIDLRFSDSTSVIQGGLAWTDPSRPAYESAVLDPNVGHNESLDVFNNGGNFEVGTTMFVDNEFSFGPSDDVLAVVRPDGLSLLINNDTLIGCENPTVFTVNGGGLDLIDIPESAPGTIYIGEPVSVASSSTSSTLPAATTEDDSSSGGSTSGDDTSDGGSTTTTSGEEGGSDSDTPIWPWLLGIFGIGLIGGGFSLLRTDGGSSTTTFPVVAGFEKGTSGSSHIAVGGGT